MNKGQLPTTIRSFIWRAFPDNLVAT